ncbi:MAG: hypothetical protein JW860_16460 [Sedimentisphaerales bacterium]|nr:hypothetical protein [Sedimentisphaerales bacterium]
MTTSPSTAALMASWMVAYWEGTRRSVAKQGSTQIRIAAQKIYFFMDASLFGLERIAKSY